MKICESDKSSSEMNIIFEWMTEVERKTSTTRLVGGCLAWMLLVMFAISGIAMDTEFAFDLFFWTTILGMGVGGILWIGVRSRVVNMAKHYWGWESWAFQSLPWILHHQSQK